MKGHRFVSLEFADDPNVVGRTYWYLCDEFPVELGDWVVAPIGSHDKRQTAVVRRIMYADGLFAPYPVERIKRVISPVEERI